MVDFVRKSLFAYLYFQKGYCDGILPEIWMSDTLKILMAGTLPKHMDTIAHVPKKFYNASKQTTPLRYSSNNMVYALLFFKPTQMKTN